MAEPHEIELRQVENYRFACDFGPGIAVLTTDETPPLGGGAGPSPVALLLAAVGSCMSSSFHFAMTKFRETPGMIRTNVSATMGRDEHNHLRVQAILVVIQFAQPAASIGHLDRIVGQFEQFCTVGASVARGIPITVQVVDGAGTPVKA
ncbi:hypothetical protein ACOSOMT5_P1752 [Acidiphilium sp. MT5]